MFKYYKREDLVKVIEIDEDTTLTVFQPKKTYEVLVYAYGNKKEPLERISCRTEASLNKLIKSFKEEN
jgi:hypothetical protein